jgi:tRNA-dihydrouridine synthase B
MSLDFLGLSQSIDTPLFLAPQAGVSESPFRRLCREFGADVVSTEFVSARGILGGNEKTREYLRFHDDERPIGIQIFGSDPSEMADAAALVTEVYAPDFVDINFGCPVKKVVKRNGGSGCLRDLDLVRRIVRAVVGATHLPVTTKIRSGFDEESRDPVRIGLTCQEGGSRMVTLHPRTRADMYSGSARWDEIAALKEASSVPIVGNGDVCTGQDVLDMAERTGCDGVMIARGSHGRPWLFAQARAVLDGRRPLPDPGVEERFRVCLRHAMNAIAFEGDASKAVVEFRKHLGWYTKGLPGGRRIRAELHRVNRLDEIEEMLEGFLSDLGKGEASADRTGAAA